MTRVNVTTWDEVDGRTLAGHFNIDKAERIDEDTVWNGHNWVSVHTTDQFAHQILFRTAGGRWVLNTWSQRQNIQETYSFIADAEAETWLLKNNSDDIVAKYFGEVEEERGPGRPAIGGLIKLRLGDDLLAKVDQRRARTGATRPDFLRDLIETGVNAL